MAEKERLPHFGYGQRRWGLIIRSSVLEMFSLRHPEGTLEEMLAGVGCSEPGVCRPPSNGDVRRASGSAVCVRFLETRVEAQREEEVSSRN